MALTGLSGDHPLMSPAPLTACADGALAALQLLVNSFHPSFRFDFRGATLLGERARLMGLQRAGATSPGGACRLLPTLDGLLAISLPRDDDWVLVPAWLETAVDDWAELAAILLQRSSDSLIERARLLGLAVAHADQLPSDISANISSFNDVTGAIHVPTRPPMVLDLSNLWAGPLAASLLAIAGARVIKVESSDREDGARHGHAGFFDLLNANKESVILDLSAATGRADLEALIQRADIVIESARPRALEQMGIYAAACIEDNPELVWTSITAYGRSISDSADPDALGIGFGDDVGAGAGLTALLNATHGINVFCGDAIADPLTGIHAAFFAYRQWLSGRGALLDIPMRAVTKKCAEFAPATNVAARARHWDELASANAGFPVYPLRTSASESPVPGADTQKILNEFDVAC